MLDEMLNYLLQLIRFHNSFFKQFDLLDIQKSLVMSIIDEEYCLISLLTHLLQAIKYSTNYVQ